MQTTREYYERFTTDTAYRRRILLLFCFFLALSAEALLLSFDLPRHKELVLHVAVSSAIILLPFTMLAALARLPIGRRFVKSRFIICPFGTVTSKPECDGNAIASLLHREITAWQSQSSKGTIKDHDSKYSVPNATIALGVTSVPLDWVWTQLRFLLTGKRDVIIEGLLVDSDHPFQLKVWTSDSMYTWTEALDEGPFSAALAEAITKLTTAILESIDPVLLARIESGRWNDDEAIRLMSNEDGSREHQLELAEMTLEGQYLSQAGRLLEQLKKWRRSDDDTELMRLEGDLELRRGNFGEARAIFRKAAEHPKCKRNRLHVFEWNLADSFAYEQKYSDAIEAYERSQQQALAELCRLTGEKSLENITHILSGTFYGKRKGDITAVLWRLFQIATNRSKCRIHLGDGGLEDLLYARSIIDVIRHLDSVSSPSTDVQTAVTSAAIARHYFEINQRDAGLEAADEALRHYGSAIRGCEEQLKEAEDNTQAMVDLAWSCYGKASCLLQRLSSAAKDSSTESPVDRLAEKLVRIVRALSDSGAQPFMIQFGRARDLLHVDAKRCDEHLRQSATRLLESLVHEFELSELMAVLHDLDSLDMSAVKQLEVSIETDAALTTPEAMQTKARELGMDDEEILRLHRTLYRLLCVLATYSDHEELAKSLDTWELVVDTERSIARSYGLFDDLSLHPSRRSKAEAYYGYACLCALENNASRAATYLRLAGEAAGENSVAYLNRAILDEDLDSVRGDKEFLGSATAAITPNDSPANVTPGNVYLV